MLFLLARVGLFWGFLIQENLRQKGSLYGQETKLVGVLGEKTISIKLVISKTFMRKRALDRFVQYWKSTLIYSL